MKTSFNEKELKKSETVSEYYLAIFNMKTGNTQFGNFYQSRAEAEKAFSEADIPKWPKRLELIYTPADLSGDNELLDYKYINQANNIEYKNSVIVIK